MREKRPKETTLMTIGHSNHRIDTFVRLLKIHGIAQVADMRSTPASQYVPHFNRERLSQTLEEQGITYRFMGDTLGGRPQDSLTYDQSGRIQYHLIAQAHQFQMAMPENNPP